MARKQPTTNAVINLADIYQPQPKQQLLHCTPARQILFGGAVGGGKGQPLDSPILTPFGWKQMGDIKLGDWVVNPEGGKSQVIQIHPLGKRKIYEVNLRDGGKCKVTSDHLWHIVGPRTTLARTKSKRLPTVWNGNCGEKQIYGPAKLYTTEALMEKMEHCQNNDPQIPVASPTKFEKAIGRWGDPKTIDPYALGVLLGDGTMTSYVAISDAEGHNAARVFARTRWQHTQIKDKKGYAIRGESHKEVKQHLEKLGLLGKKADTKFVPLCYKFASPEVRLEVLRGLFDTDGYAEENGRISFTSISKQLADDVYELAYSLGIKARKVGPKPTHYLKNGKRVDCSPHYDVYLSSSDAYKVFTMPRKVNRATNQRNNYMSHARRIKSIEYVGEEQAQCITLDHPNGLYITNDYIVTHNSVGIRGDALMFGLQNPGIQMFIFRRTLKDLERTHIQVMRNEFPKEIGYINENKNTFEFFNGSRIWFCFCDNESDVHNYDSSEMHICYVDEAVQLTPYQLGYLRTRNRLGGFAEKIKQYDEKRAEQGQAPQLPYLPRTVYCTNPIGGPGRSWLKRIFVDQSEPMHVFHDADTKNPFDKTHKGFTSIFIPSKMTDNKYIDSDYAGTLTAMDPNQAKALRDGDWNVVMGAALHNFNSGTHILPKFPIPRHWTRIQSIDWGTAAPFAITWWAVSDGTVIEKKSTGQVWYVPPGAMVLYNELYGWTGKENEGLRWNSSKVARKIIEMEHETNDAPIDHRVGDPQMWAMMDGPSVKDNMYEATNGLIDLEQGPRDRKQNYANVINYLAGDPAYSSEGIVGELPMLYVQENCKQWIRTVPNLILDENEPDKGPATRGQEDHMYDATTFALGIRPYMTSEADRAARRREDYEAYKRRTSRKTMDPYATA